MAKNRAAWLLAELPALESAGVVDAATAARLRTHYAGAVQDGGLARGLSALLGAVLVGLGLILLVAHNWDLWSRGLRLFVVALPLAAGQLACVWTLRRHAGSRVWRESSAVFAALAFAAALALVAQIFQFGGDLDRYLLSCALVALPLVYALDSSALAVLAGGALLGWVGAQDTALRQPLAVLLAFATLAPHYFLVRRHEGEALRSAWLLGGLAPLLVAALTLAMPSVERWAWLWCAACALLLLQLDALLGGEASFVRRPLRVYGELGWALVALAATFPEFWRGGGSRPPAVAAPAPTAWALGLVLAAALLLTLDALRRRRWLHAGLAIPALTLAGVQGLGLVPLPTPAAVLFNLYVLAIGIAVIAAGLRERRLRGVSSGLALIAALVLLRFFGSEWSFVARGLGFVAVGLAFLAAHAWLRRRLRA